MSKKVVCRVLSLMLSLVYLAVSQTPPARSTMSYSS